MKRGISALLMLAFLALLALPAVASAVPPANDKVASRIVLPAGFPDGDPLEVTGSNVEATREDGELIPGLSPAGHSVWFGWEATGDGWVSVGSCDSAFRTIIGIFTGTEVGDLTLVASGNGSEGPDCPYEGGRQYTFFATAGTEYVIAVDGNNFHLPESPAPVTEGEFELEIKETPLPPNDDFENAVPLEGQIEEEPGGARRYMAYGKGFNWNATNEHGEPNELLSGASVWYTWVVPEDGTYSFGNGCCENMAFDLYSGDAIDGLEPVLVGDNFAKLTLAAGQKLGIRVSGMIDAITEEPAMESFSILVTAELASLEMPPMQGSGSTPIVTPTPSSPDITAPRTTITKTVLKRQPPVFVFKFGSSEPGSTFRCRLDRGKFKPCGSSKRFGHATQGLHKLRVVAIDPAGNADPTPAVGRFRFPPPQR